MSFEQQRTEMLVEPLQTDASVIANKAMLQGGGLMTGVFTLIGGLMWLRRKFSQSGLEVKKDIAEGHLLEIVMRERNSAMEEAREAWAKRAMDAELIGKLSAQVEALNQLNHKTNNEVHLLRLLNEKQTKELEELRRSITLIREQLDSCTNCPLRRGRNEN